MLDVIRQLGSCKETIKQIVYAGIKSLPDFFLFSHFEHTNIQSMQYLVNPKALN